MALSEVSLKWNGFEANMLNNLKYVFRDEDYSDVSLVCEGISIKSHKVVLSACSPLFKNIFVQNPQPNMVIVLQDITLFNLKSLLTFIYNGEVHVNQEHLSELLKAAENLKIRGLTTIPEESDEVTNLISKDTPKAESNRSATEVFDMPNMDHAVSPFVGEIIPKEEPPDLICVETIINEGYANDSASYDTNSLYSHSEVETNSYANGVKKLTVENAKLKNGKIKKKKIKLKKKSNILKTENYHKIKDPNGEVGKENMVTDADIEKDNMDNVLQSDIVLEAFNNGSVEEELKNDQSKTPLEYGGPKFPCPFCSRTYHTWGYRRRHVKSRHRTNRLTCKICLEQTTSQSTWFDHVVHSHAVGRAEARNSLVILVEAHAVLTCTSPPSPTHLLNDFQKENDLAALA